MLFSGVGILIANITFMHMPPSLLHTLATRARLRFVQRSPSPGGWWVEGVSGGWPWARGGWRSSLWPARDGLVRVVGPGGGGWWVVGGGWWVVPVTRYPVGVGPGGVGPGGRWVAGLGMLVVDLGRVVGPALGARWVVAVARCVWCPVVGPALGCWWWTSVIRLTFSLLSCILNVHN